MSFYFIYKNKYSFKKNNFWCFKIVLIVLMIYYIDDYIEWFFVLVLCVEFFEKKYCLVLYITYL